MPDETGIDRMQRPY